MRTRFLSLVLVGLLAGCSAELDNIAQHGTAAVSPVPTVAALHLALTPGRRTVSAVAALPDRGNLMAYDKREPPVQHGAYRWHAVEVSEAHALNSIGGGELVVTGPNGRPMRFAYVRHFEHPDGNWTWVGRPAGAKPGVEAILTFGQKAVFGSIPYDDQEPLRLTTGGGRTWLMETDRALAASQERASTAHKPDFLVPPKSRSNASPQSDLGLAPMSAAATTAVATTSAATTVDLLLGYTAGFATRLGGQSQAVTRLTFLVDVTNQAYANSLIDARIRLVKTVQVDYPDATSNQAALYELTGVSCTETAGGLRCSESSSPPSLQPLRLARAQYGADLVSLVRNFNDPENESCGIAWLIGGGQTPIVQSDADSGMSIVSDSNGTGGPSSFPDNGYVCRDETLAHELGHNMGNAHDRDTADGADNVLQSNEYGRYPYSFGYKTAVGTGNFYTVMAYGSAGQTRYRVFSNPGITYCGGFACGLADQADDARSLRQTMPIVASFAATVVTATRTPTDINGDGKSDLLWKKDNAVGYWLMDGLAVSGSGYGGSGGPGFKVVAAGDYDGDGLVDLAWSNGNQLRFWINDRQGAFVSSAGIYYGPEWQPFASVDLDSDGKYDLLWRQGSYIGHWLMDGATVRTTGYTGNGGPGFKVISAGDFNGDGASDLALANENQLKIWLNGGQAQFSEASTTFFGGGWEPFASGDINADGKSDLMWRNGSALGYWIMDGANVSTSGYAGDAGAGFVLVASGDYNGDKAGDFLFANGYQMKTWINNGTGIFASSISYYGDGWQPFDPTLPSY